MTKVCNGILKCFFVGYLFITDLINARKVEHVKIKKCSYLAVNTHSADYKGHSFNPLALEMEFK